MYAGQCRVGGELSVTYTYAGAGWYLRQKPVGGGSKAGGLLHPSLSLPYPFPFPLSFQTNKWKGRSDPVRVKFPGFPPTNTTLCRGVDPGGCGRF